MTDQELTRYLDRRWIELGSAHVAAKYDIQADLPAGPDALLQHLCRQFARVLYDKARRARDKYDFHPLGWATPDWQAELQQGIAEHLAKGDPRDVAVYAMFAWFHGWPTAPTPPATVEAGGAESQGLQAHHLAAYGYEGDEPAGGGSGQWVPVKSVQGPPPFGTLALVYIRERGEHQEVYNSIQVAERTLDSHSHADWFTHNGERVSSAIRAPYGVTHWQPLPQAPATHA